MTQPINLASRVRPLGASGINVVPIGVGTNKWGAAGKREDTILPAFRAALDAGLDFIDTAELYTRGNSERCIGNLRRQDQRRVVICTKFAPLPTRLSAASVLAALDHSLARLQANSVDLYLVHFPFTLLRQRSLMGALAQAVRTGKVRAVGVSNYSAKQLRTAAAFLAALGIPLAANEVQYSLLHRAPEVDGVLDACRELNVALIAYFPLGAALLRAAPPPDSAHRPDPRVGYFMQRMITGGHGTSEQRQRLVDTLQRVALAHGATVSQVALNWLLQQDPHVIVIPGATSADHVRENGGALQWALQPDEHAAIEAASLPWRR